ncbi:MAG: hypothetical protein R2834_05600 [Rhodothermales bacterium]
MDAYISKNARKLLDNPDTCEELNRLHHDRKDGWVKLEGEAFYVTRSLDEAMSLARSIKKRKNGHKKG